MAPADVTWLWNVHDRVGLDYGGRVPLPDHGQFVEYENEQQFEPLARHLAILAADRVERQRHLFGTLEAAAASLQETPASDLRGSLDAGVALGLVGEGGLGAGNVCPVHDLVRVRSKSSGDSSRPISTHADALRACW